MSHIYVKPRSLKEIEDSLLSGITKAEQCGVHITEIQICAGELQIIELSRHFDKETKKYTSPYGRIKIT